MASAMHVSRICSDRVLPRNAKGESIMWAVQTFARGVVETWAVFRSAFDARRHANELDAVGVKATVSRIGI